MKTLPILVSTLLSGAIAPTASAQWQITDSITGQAEGDLSLTTLAAAGDVDGDGYDDILVGAGGASANQAYAGAAYIYSGATHQQLFRIDGRFQFELLGTSVLPLADVNHDGFQDILIGSPGRDRIALYSGLNGKVLYRIQGPLPSDLGRSLVKVSDFDGDNIDDFAAGAPNLIHADATKTGGITIFSGVSGRPIQEILPPSDSAHHGGLLAACGDLDGDGIDDFTTWAWINDSQWVMVYSGADASEIWRKRIVTSGFGVIESMANAGDLNQDGIEDLAIGMPHRAVNGKPGTGRVYMLSGGNGKIIHRIDGSEPGGGFGTTVFGQVDIDLDGATDLVISSVKKVIGLSGIHAYSGRTGQLISSYYSTQHGDEMGHAMAVIGDTDGDGYQEIAIAAPAYDATGGTDHGAVYIADLD